MDSCCRPPGADIFDDRLARRDLRRYRQRGLDPTGRRVLRLLTERGVKGADVLEVGGGVGGLQLELLRAGAARVTNVELSPSYEAAAEELFAEAGFEDRADFVVADFAEEAASLDKAEVVVLHRVICCYPDGELLTDAAAAVAKRFVAMTFPRSSWWIRLIVRGENLWHRLRRHVYRAYVHPPTVILGAARRQGFEPTIDLRLLFWRLLILERRPAD